MINKTLIYREFGKPNRVLQPERVLKEKCSVHHLRVKMLYSPVNASDLIPISGAYRHRVTLPGIAGYEGVGVVIEAPAEFSSFLGRRVLPLRGEGTWQTYSDCLPEMAIQVPDDIDDILASRAYINPLAARLMLRDYPPTQKNIILTAAGSDCALLLGQWARQLGASCVYGVYRSPHHKSKLQRCGITPVQQNDTVHLTRCAKGSDIVYDAVGGSLAEFLLGNMKRDGRFVSYGLLSGHPYKIQPASPATSWFHIRNYLDDFSNGDWQLEFSDIWRLLRKSELNEYQLFTSNQWREAIDSYYKCGRLLKPILMLNK